VSTVADDQPFADRIFIVRKLGLSGRELAMGAIGSGGVQILNGEVVRV
jgi:hypothetical protein